jgi:hypothetical protein
MSEQIEPGEGWRIVDKQKDTKRPGDEYWACFGVWAPASNDGILHPEHVYRRRIPAKPEWFAGPNISTYESGPLWLMETGEEKTLIDPNEAREFAAWLNRYADWREAQDAGK